MADGRIFLQCRKCEESLLLAKFGASIGWCHVGPSSRLELLSKAKFGIKVSDWLWLHSHVGESLDGSHMEVHQE